jgi:NAD(P)-dependent dehydrogenase (short-subunit alcohol dehydrogenase family)
MPGRISRKSAIVTGGARGIGAAIVRRYLEEGARVSAEMTANRGLDKDPQHPQRKPQSMRVRVPMQNKNISGTEALCDVTRVFDGIFFVDETKPATRSAGNER